MPRKQSKAFPGGIGPVPHDEEFGSDDEPTRVDIHRLLEGTFDSINKNFFDRMTSHFDRQEKVWKNLRKR